MDHQVVRTHRIVCKELDDKLATKLAAAPAAAVADVPAGTADLTYSANEVTLINDTKTQLNALLAALRTAGIITT